MGKSTVGDLASNLALKDIDLIFHSLARLSLTFSIILPLLCKLGGSELHDTLRACFGRQFSSLDNR
jgi:hypothetical protein